MGVNESMESGFGEVNAVEGQFDIPVAGVNKGDAAGKI